MINMKTFFTFGKNILLVCGCIILITIIGCKSPTDLDSNINEVPISTKPVNINDITFEFNGGGVTSRINPNSTPDKETYNFNKHEIEHIFIDTTDRNNLKVALSFKGRTDVPDRSQFEEALPYEIDIDCDTMIIPILASMPTKADQKKPVRLKEAKIKTYFFGKRRESNGVRIIKTEQEFDLLENAGYNSMNLDVFAIRTPRPGKGFQIFVESRFIVQDAEVESLDKKVLAPFGGRFLLKIKI
jgi:hypothetical protein